MAQQRQEEQQIMMTPGTLNMTVQYATLKKRMEELQMFVREYMIPGEDYGNIPGINKPTLLKPGAEKLCDVYGLAVGMPIIECDYNDSKEPTFIKYTVTVPILSRQDGRVLMHGVGSCSSYEKKHKYRWAFENEVPSHMNIDSLKTTQRGKYTLYQIPNDEIDDLDNTLLKMAKKRGLIDGVLSVTRSSALFTQDVEDMDIKTPDTTKRDEQRQQKAGQNQQSRTTHANHYKSKSIELMKALDMNWNELAEIASATLERKISKVISDVKSEDEWQKIADKLQEYETERTGSVAE